MAVDLHLHSKYSDGDLDPAEVIDRAVAAGLTTIALTDHDTFEGLVEARTAAAGRIRVVPGVELSVEWAHGSMHLLGYWVDTGSRLDDELEALRESRRLRNEQMVAALADLGVPITVEEVLAVSQKGVVTRPDIAEVLVDRGVVDTVAQAFDRYLASGRPAYRSRHRLTVEQALTLVRDAGGVTVVAHPHTTADDAAGFREAFEAFADLGITGVECWYPEYPIAQREAMAALAERLGLVPAGGSDFHGPLRKPGLEVGVGRGDLVVPDRVVEGLEARRG